MPADPITQPLPQSAVSQLLKVSPAKLIQARKSLTKPDHWFQEAGSNKILYTPQGIKALIESGFGDPALLAKLQPTGQIVHSPSQPLYREPELPRWEREPVESLAPDCEIQPFSQWGRSAEIEYLRQSPVQYSAPANYPAAVNPPHGGIHGGSGGVVIINGDVNYHRSSVRESSERATESSFSVTRKQQELLMYGMVAVVFLGLLTALVNTFRPAVTIQPRAPYEQQIQ